MRLLKIENARMNVPELEYLDVTANEAVLDGEALVLASGKLTKCGATTKPKFVAQKSLSATDTNRTIPVIRVEANQVYEVYVTAAPTALNVGDKVTLTTDGCDGTATTTSGVLTIVALDGATASGDPIKVRVE